MNRDPQRRLRTPGPEEVLADLTTRQHLRPLAPLADVLERSAAALGLCPIVARRAVAWLELDPGRAVGRLTRTELTQLSRCVARYAQQAHPPAALEPADARPPDRAARPVVPPRA